MYFKVVSGKYKLNIIEHDCFVIKYHILEYIIFTFYYAISLLIVIRLIQNNSRIENVYN